MTFREYAESACGMTGEYPCINRRAEISDAGYDDVIEPGMVICVESYIRANTGGEGVKLEEQLLVTETGNEVMSKFPFECSMLS